MLSQAKHLRICSGDADPELNQRFFASLRMTDEMMCLGRACLHAYAGRNIDLAGCTLVCAAASRRHPMAGSRAAACVRER